MATGLELLVATALCVSCPNETIVYPDGLLFVDESYEVVTETPILDKVDASLDDAPAETLHTILEKAEKLKKLREWVNGRHLRIATLEDYPLSYTETQPDGTKKGMGVSFILLDFLKEKFGFTYEVMVPKGNIIGSKSDYGGSLIEMLNSSVGMGKFPQAHSFIIIILKILASRYGCSLFASVIRTTFVYFLFDHYFG